MPSPPTTALALICGLLVAGCAAPQSEPESTSTSAPTVTSTSTAVTTAPEGDVPVEDRPLPTLAFVTDYGGSGFDYAQAVAVAGSGDILVAADYRSPDSNNGDVVLLRFSPAGELTWARSWGGSDEDHPLRNTLAVDEDGAALLGAAIYDPTTQDRDLALLKFDPDGELLWQKVGLDVDGEQRPHSVLLDGSGDVYVAGHHEVEHRHRLLLLKFNSDGRVIWQRALAADGSVESAYAAALDSDENLIVSGTAGEAGEVDALIVKLDSNGMVLWQRKWGASPHPERATDVVTDSEGNIYVSGPVVGVGSGGDSTFVLKLDGDGTLLWARIWRVPGNEVWAHGSDFDESGLLVISGFIGSVVVDGQSLSNSGYVLGISPEGDLLWQAAVGSNRMESIEAIRSSGDGGLIAVGQGARAELTVAPLNGEFLVTDIELKEAVLIATELDLPFGDAGFDIGEPAGQVGGVDGADVVLIRLLLP